MEKLPWEEGVDSQCRWCRVVECEHVNKTGLISQLESKLNDLKIQLDLPPKKHQSKEERIKSKLDDLKNRLMKEINGHRFKLKPEQFSPEVSDKHYHTSSKKVTFQCKMKQIPANSNDATTGHKLQGMTKAAIIVSSWSTRGIATIFKNWEYVVLSRV